MNVRGPVKVQQAEGFLQADRPQVRSVMVKHTRQVVMTLPLADRYTVLRLD
jgi:hypothetical protein